MGGLHGVKNLKEAMDFGFAIGKGIDAALADGKLDLNDVILFMPAVLAAGPALKDIGEALKEWKELDAEDEKLLVEAGKAHLAGIPDQKKAKVVGKALRLVMDVGALVTALREAKETAVPTAAEGGAKPVSG